MKKLFSDSETFTKERPTKLTEKQFEQFFMDMASQIVGNGYSDDDPEFIVEDLKGLSFSDSGYEMAKELEKWGSNAEYKIDSQFIEFLEDLYSKRQRRIGKNVKQWAEAHKPQPKFKKGDRLKIAESLSHLNKAGQEIYITGVRMEDATYLVWPTSDHNGGYVYPFERIEASCSI